MISDILILIPSAFSALHPLISFNNGLITSDESALALKGIKNRANNIIFKKNTLTLLFLHITKFFITIKAPYILSFFPKLISASLFLIYNGTTDDASKTQPFLNIPIPNKAVTDELTAYL